MKNFQFQNFSYDIMVYVKKYIIHSGLIVMVQIEIGWPYII
jgi:hypothetical protein